MPPGFEDRSIGPRSSEGIFDRPVGNKGKSSPKDSFQDLFMQAVANDNSAKVSSSTVERSSKPDSFEKALPHLIARTETKSAKFERPQANIKDNLKAAIKSPLKGEDLAEASRISAGSSFQIKTDAAKVSAPKSGPDNLGEQTESVVTPKKQNSLVTDGGLEAVFAQLSQNAMTLNQYPALNNASWMMGDRASELAAKVGEVNVEAMPSAVSLEAPSITEDLSTAQLEDLLARKVHASELPSLFQIDPSVLNTAGANILKIDAAIAAQDLLTAIKVEPNLISSDLSKFEQYLPSELMNAPIGDIQDLLKNALNDATQINLDSQKSGLFQGANVMSALRQPAEQVLTTNNRKDAFAASVKSESVTTKSGALLSAAKLSSSPTDSAKPSLKKSTDTEQDANTLIDSLLSVKIGGQISAPTNSLLSANDIKTELSDISALDGSLVSADSVQDPYAQLGLELNQVDVKTSQFTPTIVGGSMQSLEEQLYANGFRLDAASNTQEIQINSSIKDVKTEAENIDPSNLDIPLFDAKSDPAANVSSNVSGDISGIKIGIQDSNLGDSSQGDGSRNFEQIFSRDGVGSLAGVKTTSIDGTGFVTTLKDGTNSNDLGSSVHSKILQHASLLLRDGGGSMRMDVTNGDMGKIDLAINLINNQLDVRILTANDLTRDIINKELSGLRDGLGQQGISLRNVEIGSSSSTPQHFSGNFSQGSQNQHASYNEMKEYSKSFAESFNSNPSMSQALSKPSLRGPIASGWGSNRPLGSSSISVRV
jgi:hypothetical protein